MSPFRGFRLLSGEDGGDATGDARARVRRIAALVGGSAVAAGALYFFLMVDEPEPPPVRVVSRPATAAAKSATKSATKPAAKPVPAKGANAPKGVASAKPGDVKPSDAAKPVPVPAKAAAPTAQAKPAAPTATAQAKPGAPAAQAKPGAPVAQAAAKPGAPVAQAAAKPGAPVAQVAPGSPAKPAGAAAPATPAPTTAPATPGQAPATPGQAPARPVPGPASAEMSQVTIQREIYSYDGGRRRDPFMSLARPTGVGPLLAELKLLGIAYDEGSIRGSVAVLRDGQKAMYRLRVGQTIGRARVAAIGRRSVTFAVEEFGVTRQEVLSISDTTRKRR